MFIVKVPGINGLGKTKGCEKAGNAILDALSEIHTNELGVPIDKRLLDLEEIHLDNFNLELTNDLIYKNAFETFEEKSRTIFLGGDHSISFSLTHAFLDYCQSREEVKEPCLIVFDAHSDLMKPVDGNFPTHEEWLRGIIEKGFPVENILLVGVRNQDPSEIQFLKEKGIRMISMNKLMGDLHETCDTIMEFASGKELYVSIDVDIIDPAFASATGYCEPGGLTSREFLYIVQRINKMKNLKAVDIVEINPDKEGAKITIQLGSKILSELI
jgi:agmatinase